MKKFFPFAILGCLVSLNAFAGCKLLSCDSFFWPNAWVKANANGNQCWGCGPGRNSCGYHDVVPYRDGLGEVIALYQCTFGFSNSFESYNPGEFCAESQLSAASINSIDLTNAKKTYQLKGRATEATDLGDWDVFTGSASCIYVKCNEGFVPNSNKTKCVTDTREATCTNSGGVWKSGACECDSVKLLKQNAAGTACECVSSDYEYVATSGKCEETAASKQRKQEQKNAQQAADNKKKCEASFGKWSGGKCNCDAANNLVKDTTVTCKCKDANYEPNDATKSCELKDSAIREQACKAAAQSGATWNGKECICDAAYKEWNDTQCVEMIEYTQCKGISDATWNVVAKECVCNDESKVINGAGTKCVESEETKQKREAATAQTAISDAVARLDSIVSTLDLDVSKWKTEDGKFNTARLASDSIAGVVLGTAGGLITSNVVKKHQIEDGFEDLQCVIGGQTVAGWGDEFTVGVH